MKLPAFGTRAEAGRFAERYPTIGCSQSSLMGAIQSNRKPSYDANGEVDFDHFQILRAIGKGAFGKVCIVQKKDTKAMYAMKYMNKSACIKKDAVRNVLRELEILKFLEHPFLVNLWFAFQDEEDMFMVVDLLLGGDIRYHLQQVTRFDEPRVKLYLCELGSALGYLRSKKVVHRDLKPDNLLLDEKGHVHLTDFNIATILEDGKLATSMSGTKPYMGMIPAAKVHLMDLVMLNLPDLNSISVDGGGLIMQPELDPVPWCMTMRIVTAPEVFATACEEAQGYSFGVDWWSLGVCIYEILRAKRPYEIHSNTGLSEVRQIFASESVHYPTTWSRDMIHVLHRLLQQDPKKRLDSLEALKQESLMADVDWESVEAVNVQPSFVPPKDHLNCDPTYELEEMIIEAKPLHKKKKRLKKLSTRVESEEEMDPVQKCLEEIKKDFKIYNREKLLSNRRPTKSSSSLTENNETKTSELSKKEVKKS